MKDLNDAQKELEEIRSIIVENTSNGEIAMEAPEVEKIHVQLEKLFIRIDHLHLMKNSENSRKLLNSASELYDLLDQMALIGSEVS